MLYESSNNDSESSVSESSDRDDESNDNSNRRSHDLRRHALRHRGTTEEDVRTAQTYCVGNCISALTSLGGNALDSGAEVRWFSPLH